MQREPLRDSEKYPKYSDHLHELDYESGEPSRQRLFTLKHLWERFKRESLQYEPPNIGIGNLELSI